MPHASDPTDPDDTDTDATEDGTIPPAEAEIPLASFYDDRLQYPYWADLLAQTDIPTPETRTIALTESDDGHTFPDWDTDAIQTAIADFGGRAFVRSAYKSAELNLSHGSYLWDTSPAAINRTIKELLSQHAMMQMPHGDQLVVREWLELNWCAYAHETLHPECRIFIRDGDVLCHHPRLSGFDREPGGEAFRDTAVEFIDQAWTDGPLKTYAAELAAVTDEAWAVDFVMDTDGDWWCTDMALNALYYRPPPEDADPSNPKYGWRNLAQHPDDCPHDLAKHADRLAPPDEATK